MTESHAQFSRSVGLSSSTLRFITKNDRHIPIREGRSSPKSVSRRIKIKHPDSLRHFGYREKAPESKRHSALDKAIAMEGYQKTADRLIALQVLNSNTNPKFSNMAKQDHEYIEKKHLESSAFLPKKESGELQYMDSGGPAIPVVEILPKA